MSEIQKLEADYVIVGSGAVGMAFADVILTDSDATMIIIDSFAKPGGHWNIAYPFVQLHQPASLYGVSSKELSSGRIEKTGLNANMEELSSGAEILAYYDDIMQHEFIASGRVQYFPMCDYKGDGRFVSKTGGQEYHATATKKTVDCTFLKTQVPANHKPNFKVAEGVQFMPLNDLPKVTEAPDSYVIVGAGKTGCDACVWLMENGVDPDMITWVVNREAWLLDRKNHQFRMESFHDAIGTEAAMLENIAKSESLEDMFDRLEECGYFHRVHKDVRPEMFHGATVSQGEADALRRIKNVVRMGHITEITPEEIIFQQGTLPTTPRTIHVDCSAPALRSLPNVKVFDGDVITPQMIRPYQPVFSAAVIAHCELTYEDEDYKNQLCMPVPLPNADTDFVLFSLAGMANQHSWSQDAELKEWMSGNRLDGPSSLFTDIAPDDFEKLAVLQKFSDYGGAAFAKLQQYKEEHNLVPAQPNVEQASTKLKAA